MRSQPAGRVALAGIAGALMPLAFAPFFLWWLAPVCYAVLFVAWHGAMPRQAFLSGWVFGFAQFIGGVYWIYISVHTIGQAPIWIAVILMLALVCVMALYPALVGLVAARWFRDLGAWRWFGALPALFVIAEWLRGWVATGFGWLSPGYAQTESWLLGFAPVLGVLGVGWAVWLLAGALASAWFGKRRERLAAGAVAVLVFGAAYVTHRLAWTSPKSERISVALVQGAIRQEDKWLPEQLPLTANLYLDLTREALGDDLIVWPEAAIPELYENVRSYIDGVGRLAAGAGSELMLGMLKYHAQTASAQNAVFVLSQPEFVYAKRHLVPYGEFFPIPNPVRSWLAGIGLALGDLQPGEPGQPPLELLGERIAVTICYEDVFGAEQLHSFPEATLLVNVSNDGWFGESIALPQHQQIARMRAAEVRRWLLRTTNPGFTAVIDPFGAVADQLPPFEPGVLRASVTGMTGSTPYILWGNWAVVVLAGAVLGVTSLRRS